MESVSPGCEGAEARFHVAEDLITTVVTLLLAARNAPDLIEDRVQLVFSEGFGMDQNHFTPLWDRMGAWAPRRLSLDPWGKGVCRESIMSFLLMEVSNAIHSVGAGASFLSAMGVSSRYVSPVIDLTVVSSALRASPGLLPITTDTSLGSPLSPCPHPYHPILRQHSVARSTSSGSPVPS
jgi:hypothetical protein